MTSVVFVVDDDLSVREALQSLLRSVGHVVEAFACTRDLLEHRQRMADAAGCLVLDVRLPGQSGLELIKRVRMKWPKLALVVLSCMTAQWWPPKPWNKALGPMSPNQVNLRN